MASNVGDAAGLATTDYVVFGIMLAASSAIGLFFAYKDRDTGVNNYFLGMRAMQPLPCGISLSLTIISASSIMGISAEITYFGGIAIWWPLAALFGMMITNEVFLPLFHRSDVTSCFEYFGARFNNSVKHVTTLIALIQGVMSTGIAILAPSLAISAVTGFSLWGAVIATGGICTLYTTVGGLKGVIWTDVFQAVVTICSMLIVIFKNASAMGGFERVWKICAKGNRLDFFHFEPDPRYRMTFWTIIFGFTALGLGTYSSVPATMQRLLACKTLRDGKTALYYNWIMIFLIRIMQYLLGFTTYAYFANCDPFENGEIDSRDQILPYVALQVLEDTPGLMGLFMAGIFAACLSTVSSAINGTAFLVVHNYVRPYAKWREETILRASKGLSVLFGVTCIGFAYLAANLGDMFSLALSIVGIVLGPMTGVTFLGSHFPFTNSAGAIIGFLVGVAMNTWMYIGSIIYPPSDEFSGAKNVSVSECFSPNTTHARGQTTVPGGFSNMNDDPIDLPKIAALYAVSFSYYTLIGIFVTVIVGLIGSFATGGYKMRHTVDPKFIVFPFDHRWLRWLPKRFRNFMRVETGSAAIQEKELHVEQIGGANKRQLPFEHETSRVSNFHMNASYEVEGEETKL